MREVQLPAGFRWERLCKAHARKAFASGEPRVDAWLATQAWQHQEKHLSVTKVLVNEGGKIAGFYTLATGQVDFGELPSEIAKKLPRRMLPVAVLGWLGVESKYQGQGLGRTLLAQALRDCYDAGQTFSFIAVILDAVDEQSKAFYRQFDFSELPGHPFRLYLSFVQLAMLMHTG